MGGRGTATPRTVCSRARYSSALLMAAAVLLMAAGMTPVCPMLKGIPMEVIPRTMPLRAAAAGRGTGMGRFVRGDLRERPAVTSIALACGSMVGAVIGGIMAGGFEGVLLGAAGLWMATSFADVVRSSPLVARRAFAAAERKRASWITQAQAAELRLQSAFDKTPVHVDELRCCVKRVREVGAEARCEPLLRKSEVLLAILERHRSALGDSL